LEEQITLSPYLGDCMTSTSTTKGKEQVAVLTAVADVHCRERGIDRASDEAGKVAGHVETLFNSGIEKPDDIRAALSAKSE
jgi:hypothetical protein